MISVGYEKQKPMSEELAATGSRTSAMRSKKASALNCVPSTPGMAHLLSPSMRALPALSNQTVATRRFVPPASRTTIGVSVLTVRSAST